VALMLASTTVTVTRTDGTGDPYVDATPSEVAERVRAHISAPTGSDARVGGAQEIVDAVLLTEVTPALQRADRVTCETTGDTYTITWVRRRTGLGLDHQQAGLVAVKGASNG
jgi:hypothetical protein